MGLEKKQSCSWKLPLFVVGRKMVPFRKVGDARAGRDWERGGNNGEGGTFVNLFKKLQTQEKS